ncbi:MAG: outer membrane protein assembly factor BamC [Burkholderiales bacterium]|nr:outer membrane protein assembly factor BamC [Burkholderiales bacterium]
MSRSLSLVSLRGLVLAGTLSSLFGCTVVGDALSGDKIDYRSKGEKTAGLDVPPDLTQLTRDSRYQQSQGTAVSAASYQAAASAAAPAAAASVPLTIAPQAIGDMRIERLGNERWLSSSLTPEQLWPQLQAFWKERGFRLATDEPKAGVMETDWAENRAKLPQDWVRSSIGKVLDVLYSTGERDKFRTRIERNGIGSEVYITHRGMIEVVTGQGRDNTIWQPRPSDPQLEGEFLSRLMLKLGAREEAAKAAGVSPAAAGASARARVVEGQSAATLQIDDSFDRAWRRVGVALDRSGFTVEDRDRAQGLYFVRYVDPANMGKEEPGFFAKLFGLDKKDGGPAKYRVSVKSAGERSVVSVLDGQGAPENSEAGKRIAATLLEELK